MQSAVPPWDDLRVLLAVHRGRSFLAAGKSLGVATSTVARRIDALEQSLGRPVVHRANDGTQIDSAALGLVHLAEQMELGLAALRRDTSEERIAGVVRVSLSEGFVRPVTHVLARLQVKHPALALELVSESRVANLARREADIGIRVVRTSSPVLIERSTGVARLALFASRSYVERRLPNARLPRSEAARHDFVGFDRELERMPQERWIREYGAQRFVFRSNSCAALEEAVLAGMGIGLFGDGVGSVPDGLVRLDLDASPPSVNVFLAYHRDAKKTPRVHLVALELERELRRALA